MEPLLVAGAAAVVLAAAVLWWAVSGSREQPRVDLTAGTGTVDEAPRDQRSLMLRHGVGERAIEPMIERVGKRVRGWLPSGRAASLDRKILRAGSPEGWTTERVLAAKVLLAVLFGVLLTLRFFAQPTAFDLLLALAGTVFGYFLPNGLLDSKVGQRQAAVRADIADTIDQLAVMVRAGLSVDSAIVRSARSGKGPLADELSRAVQDMRVGATRSVALANMAERVDVPELRGFVAALSQAERLGVPVSETLRVQSGEMRLKRRQYAEEQAMKLPVKILFPMVVCILPVLFIVLLGPAAIRIFEQFE